MGYRPAYIWIFAAVLALGTSCKSRTSGSSIDATLKNACTTWRKDPYGCKGERKSAIAEQIADRFQVLKLEESEIEDYLGAAESEATEAGGKTLTYFFDTSCIDGLPAKDSVYCVLEFFMNEKGSKMKEARVICG